MRTQKSENIHPLKARVVCGSLLCNLCRTGLPESLKSEHLFQSGSVLRTKSFLYLKPLLAPSLSPCSVVTQPRHICCPGVGRGGADVSLPQSSERAGLSDFSLHSCETIKSCHFKASSGWYFILAALGN
jgi:hypothetical protein